MGEIRKKIVAGNWKMNMDRDEAFSLMRSIADKLKSYKGSAEVVICPPAINLELVYMALGKKATLGAQDVSANDKGAFTGEISASMLKSYGCEFVIVGHSERRSYHSEKEPLLSKKIEKVLDNDMSVIYCCGESLEEREKGVHNTVIKRQLTRGLKNLRARDFEKVVIAYEPVWAIGTGKTASPKQAQDMHAYIRDVIRSSFMKSIADEVRILYGGSVKPDNAAELFAQPDIDGGLIGGASLKANDFYRIIKSTP